MGHEHNWCYVHHSCLSLRPPLVGANSSSKNTRKTTNQPPSVFIRQPVSEDGGAAAVSHLLGSAAEVRPVPSNQTMTSPPSPPSNLYPPPTWKPRHALFWPSAVSFMKQAPINMRWATISPRVAPPPGPGPEVQVCIYAYLQKYLIYIFF